METNSTNSEIVGGGNLPSDYGLRFAPNVKDLADEIRIVTIPRFKTSGLSGDEWRTNKQFQYLYKGKVVHTETAPSDMSCAIGFLYKNFILAAEEGKLDDIHYNSFFQTKCQQHGCSEDATAFFTINEMKNPDGTPYPDLLIKDKPKYFRGFCNNHLHRGNSDLLDNDSNYTIIKPLDWWSLSDEQIEQLSQFLLGYFEKAYNLNSFLSYFQDQHRSIKCQFKIPQWYHQYSVLKFVFTIPAHESVFPNVTSVCKYIIDAASNNDEDFFNNHRFYVDRSHDSLGTLFESYDMYFTVRMDYVIEKELEHIMGNMKLPSDNKRR